MVVVGPGGRCLGGWEGYGDLLVLLVLVAGLREGEGPGWAGLLLGLVWGLVCTPGGESYLKAKSNVQVL